MRRSPGLPSVFWRGARFVLDLKCRLPEPPAPPCAKHDLLVVLGQVGDQFAGIHVADDRADRHAQRDIVAALAVAIRSAPVFAVARQVLLRVTVVDQRVDVAVGDRVRYRPAAVAAVRPAERDEFLAAHRRTAIASVSGDDFDSCFVNELHSSLRPVFPLLCRAGARTICRSADRTPVARWPPERTRARRPKKKAPRRLRGLSATKPVGA